MNWPVCRITCATARHAGKPAEYVFGPGLCIRKGEASVRDIRITTLSDGLRVATDYIPTVESVSLGIWVGAGTRFEASQVNGVAHLLEHMVFKGTPSRNA